MTDLSAISSIQGVSADSSRLATRQNLDKAGKQFEAVFTGMMLKSMRQAKLADPLFDSKALDTFNEMSDQKLVQQMAEHTPLGIGRAMTEFLGRSQALAPAGPGDSSNVDDSTG